MEGRQKANLPQSGILGEAQLLSPNPSMGRGEEQEEVNRSAALKLASFTPITDTVMPCFMLPSQRQPCRASAPMTNVQNGKAKETMGVGKPQCIGKGAPTTRGSTASLAQDGRSRQQMACSDDEGPSHQPKAQRQAIGAAVAPQAKHTYLVHSS